MKSSVAFITWSSSVKHMITLCFLFSDRKFKAIVHSQPVSSCFSISTAIISMSLLSYFHFYLPVSVHIRLNNRISHNIGVTGDETCWWHLMNKKVFMKKFVRDQWRVSISFNILLRALFKGMNLKTTWNSCDCFRGSSGGIKHYVHV